MFSLQIVAIVATILPLLLKKNKFLAVNVVALVITMVKFVRNVLVSDIIITDIKVERLRLLQVVDIDVGQGVVNVLFHEVN